MCFDMMRRMNGLQQILHTSDTRLIQHELQTTIRKVQYIRWSVIICSWSTFKVDISDEDHVYFFLVFTAAQYHIGTTTDVRTYQGQATES